MKLEQSKEIPVNKIWTAAAQRVILRIARITLSLALASATALATAAAFPERPVRLVVPYPAGGGTDGAARLVAQKLSEVWGKAVVVDNRPGADTQIGNAIV
ncbi:MAG: hypothetical protein ABI854_03890, partial [Betaproteobacteria bacterium]